MKTSACTDSCTEGIWSAPGRCLHAIQCEIGGHLERENESHRSSSYGVSGGVSAIYNTYWEMRNQMIIIQDHCMCHSNSAFQTRKRADYLLAIDVLSIFLPQKPLGGPTTFPWIKLCLIRPGVWWWVFVLGIWLADPRFSLAPIGQRGGSIPQPRGTSFFRGLRIHAPLGFRHTLCFCSSETRRY